MVSDGMDLDGGREEKPKAGWKRKLSIKKPSFKKLPIKWIGIGLAAVVVLVAICAAGWYFLGYGDPPPPEETAEEMAAEMVKPYDFEEIYTLETFADMELRGGGKKRWFTVKLALEMDNPVLRDELGMNEPTIREIVAPLLSNRTYDEISGVDGKILLRNQLIRAINRALSTGRVRNLYFTEFVVYFES